MGEYMAVRTLITGGLGFLGAPLTRALVQQGQHVRVLDNASRGSRERLGDVAQEVELLEGDVRDPLRVWEAARGMERVIHLAFVNGTEYFYKYPAYVLDVGVKGMVNVLDASLMEGVRELVLASSSEVYQTPPTVPTDESVPLIVPDPHNPRYSYAAGKIVSELMAIHYGKEHFERVLIVRPHNVYGPAMGEEHVIPQFIRRMLHLRAQRVPEPIDFSIQGDGAQTRAFIEIEDFTAALLLVLEQGEHLEIYHIGTQEEVTIADLAQEIARHLGLTITLQPTLAAPGGTLRRCPDTRKLRSLGFQSRISLDEGLKRAIQWYSQHPAPAATLRDPSLFLPTRE
jgi:nucleoside-diphosphate-sugar epimerase